MAGSSIRMIPINAMVNDIKYKVQILARTHKVESAIMDSGIVGFSVGVIIAFVMIIVPLLLIKGGIL
ncbi:MAG TPA: tetrahydromethanopterin S-methyltransferase subunit F [Methanocorpusculum sp.]|nr:tetrahydromethanopterin S-methyltransferase subunit F [Methanocorpusculum sp.]